MLRTCVQSVLASDHPSFEVIIADQSTVPMRLEPDPRLVHLHLESRGKSSALNAGIAQASAPVIAFTDDDCTVPTHWLRRGESVFEQHPEVSLLFGDLKPMEHDPEELFVPGTMLGRFEILQGWAAIVQRGGAGANCFARRALFDVIAGWDEMIGPGSRFAGCEEFDLVLSDGNWRLVDRLRPVSRSRALGRSTLRRPLRRGIAGFVRVRRGWCRCQARAPR